MRSVWLSFAAAVVVAALVPASVVLAQGRRPREPVEPAYEEDYGDEDYGDEEYGDEGYGEEEYGEEGVEEEWPAEEGGYDGIEDQSVRPSEKQRPSVLRERAINPQAPRWNWGPWCQLRVKSDPTFPVGVFLARGANELSFGYSFQGGLVDPEDFNDATVLETESGYSALELNYRRFLGGAGEGWWVGGGAALVSYDVELSTTDGMKGDTSSTFNVLRAGAGYQWRSGNFEFGAGGGVDLVPDTEAKITASNSLGRRTTKAELDSGTSFYLVVSAGYRF